MIDLFANADPVVLPLWMVLAFAASFYPLGIMLGASCSPCCSQPCSSCTEGSLPETVTVTFSGFDDRTRSDDLCSLAFSSCYGSGASGKVNAPGGDRDTDAGPISEVQLLQSGSGYAKLGRVAPTLSVTGSGVDAEFTVTLSQEQDGCGIDYWKVGSVSVKNGNGYTDGESLVISVAEGDHYESEASLTLSTQRTEPELVFQDNNGSADLAIEITQNAGTPETWSVTGVTIEDGGAGYYYGEELYIVGKTADDKASYQGASILLKTELVEPTLAASVDSQTGVNASLSLTLTESTAWDGRAVWGVTAIAIDNAGAGYAVGDSINIIVQDGYDYGGYFSASVSEVSESGGIVAVDLQYGGEYYKDLGVIIDFDWGYGYYYDNSYYRDAGVPSAVTVNTGGVYYREDPDEDPYVAEVTVTVNQNAPSDGNGAVITATVEDDTASADFGKIVSLSIDNGGAGYLAWHWLQDDCCATQLNGIPFVLRRNAFSAGTCIYTHKICGGWRNFYTTVLQPIVEYRGPELPPRVYFTGSPTSEASGLACSVTLTATSNVTNCGELSFTAENAYYPGITATVIAGGEYDSNARGRVGSTGALYSTCTKCCQGESDFVEEITISVAGDIPAFFVDWEPDPWPADYVLPKSVNGVQLWSGSFDGFLNPALSEVLGSPQTFAVSFSVSISPDHCDSAFPGCEFCIKKCHIGGSVYATYTAGVNAGASIPSLARAPVASCFNHPNPCSECRDTPLCNPMSGEVITLTGPNNDGCPDGNLTFTVQ